MIILQELIKALRLDVTELDRFAKCPFWKDQAELTQRAYGSGQRKFITFYSIYEFLTVLVTKIL